MARRKKFKKECSMGWSGGGEKGASNLMEECFQAKKARALGIGNLVSG